MLPVGPRPQGAGPGVSGPLARRPHPSPRRLGPVQAEAAGRVPAAASDRPNSTVTFRLAAEEAPPGWLGPPRAEGGDRPLQHGQQDELGAGPAGGGGGAGGRGAGVRGGAEGAQRQPEGPAAGDQPARGRQGGPRPGQAQEWTAGTGGRAPFTLRQLAFDGRPKMGAYKGNVLEQTCAAIRANWAHTNLDSSFMGIKCLSSKGKLHNTFIGAVCAMPRFQPKCILTNWPPGAFRLLGRILKAVTIFH
jgi:hypothetical protein